MLLKKNSDFGGGKIKSDSEFLSYNLMLNSGKKNILTLVLSTEKIMNEKKPIAPSLQVKWSVPKLTSQCIWTNQNPRTKKFLNSNFVYLYLGQ